MSLDAIKWALAQAVGKASTKFVLVAMADCVNAETSDMLCWPSYAYLSRVTLHDIKTVEAAVFRLRETGLIVDTGMRRGETGKVVVYRLNPPETGGIEPGPQNTTASLHGAAKDTKTGVISLTSNAPVFPANPPKNGDQSPQISQLIPPKTGVRTRKKQEGTEKEPGTGALMAAGIPEDLLTDWLAVRKDKRAGTLTKTAADGLLREAGKAEVSPEAAVRYCIEQNWIGFNAGWYRDRTARSTPTRAASGNRHSAAARAIWGSNPDPEIIDAETH